jgi:hypothetical protein
VVISMELKCTEAKKLQCVMEARSLPEFLDEVDGGLFLHDPYVSVMYVPTYQPDELTNKNLKNVVIYRWKPVDKSVNNVNNRPMLSHLSQTVEIKLQEQFGITSMLRLFPELVPYYMMYLVTRMVVGKNDRISVGPWPTIHYQTAFPWEINDMDCLFEVSKDCHEIREAFTQLAKALAEAAEKGEYPVDYAAYARLFAGTNGGLSTSSHADGKYVCGFDIVSSPGTKGYEAFRHKTLSYFLGSLHAKPHWGKDVPMQIDVQEDGKAVPVEINYQKLYGANYEMFFNALLRWYDKNHLDLENSMFLNGFLCNILNLPYAPLPIYQQGEKHEATISPAIQQQEAAKLARDILPFIQGNDIYAQNFRKRLKHIANANQEVSVKNLSLFRQPSNDSIYEEKVIKLEDRVPKKSCNIL